MLPVCFLNASENPCKYNLDAERRTISQLVVNVQQLAYESHCTQIEDRAIYNGLIEEAGKQLCAAYELYNQNQDKELAGEEVSALESLEVENKILKFSSILRNPICCWCDIEDLKNQKLSMRKYGTCTILQAMDRIKLQEAEYGDVADLGDIYVTVPNQEEIAALAGKYSQLRKIKCKLLDVFQSYPLCLRYIDNQKHHDSGRWQLRKGRRTFVIRLLNMKPAGMPVDFWEGEAYGPKPDAKESRLWEKPPKSCQQVAYGPFVDLNNQREQYKKEYRKWLLERKQQPND